MIPKRAIFFWEGGGMSWLRRQSLATFSALNPSWEVVTIDGSSYGEPKNGRILETAHRSDRARYAELARRGGVYFDTDIIFFKPFPEPLLLHDEFVPYGDEGRPGHVAMLGSVPGGQYFSMLSKVADSLAVSERPLSYQSLGLCLLDKYRPPASVAKIEADLVVPVKFMDTIALWSESSPYAPPERSFGLHWYGGDHLSAEMEPRACESWALESGCLVASCLRKTAVFA